MTTITLNCLISAGNDVAASDPELIADLKKYTRETLKVSVDDWEIGLAFCMAEDAMESNTATEDDLNRALAAVWSNFSSRTDDSPLMQTTLTRVVELASVFMNVIWVLRNDRIPENREVLSSLMDQAQVALDTCEGAEKIETTKLILFGTTTTLPYVLEAMEIEGFCDPAMELTLKGIIADPQTYLEMAFQ